ncbi:hypothetical protein GGR52DRAFT_551367 [Hypoxylon sp. FL1284]|nr:hypothetical protein GGR52DRAFT_551367 [Hypoxylon sp. FL1284]
MRIPIVADRSNSNSNSNSNSSHSHSNSVSNIDANPYPFNRPSLFASSSHSFTSRRPAANALPSFQLPSRPFQQSVQPPQQPVLPIQPQAPTPPIDPSDYIDSRVDANDGISQFPSGSSSDLNNSCFPSSQAGLGYLRSTPPGPLSSSSSSSPSSTLTPISPGAQSVLMQSTYTRAPYSPPTSGCQGSQSPDGLHHHSYEGVSSPFSLPTPARSGSHSSMHTLQSSIISAPTQGAQPPTPTTTASPDNYSRSSNSNYYQPPPATSHPLSYSAYAPVPGTTGAYSRGVPAYSHSSQNHSVPSSPMQAPSYPHRPYSSFTPLPTMAGPVLSNMSNPGGQMALVGTMTTIPPGYPGHHRLQGHGFYTHGAHKTPSDRPFKCPTCSAGFNRNHDLKRHTKIHLEVKPFPCGFCEKAFSRKDALKRHRMVKSCGEGLKEESKNGNESFKREEIKPEDDDSPGILAVAASLRA